MANETYDNERRAIINAQNERIQELGTEDAVKQNLEETYGQLWDTKQLQEEFTVDGFLAPFVVVRRKSDGQRGTMMFTHMPRYYYGFQEE